MLKSIVETQNNHTQYIWTISSNLNYTLVNQNFSQEKKKIITFLDCCSPNTVAISVQKLYDTGHVLRLLQWKTSTHEPPPLDHQTNHPSKWPNNSQTKREAPTAPSSANSPNAQKQPPLQSTPASNPSSAPSRKPPQQPTHPHPPPQ